MCAFGQNILNMSIHESAFQEGSETNCETVNWTVRNWHLPNQAQMEPWNPNQTELEPSEPDLGVDIGAGPKNYFQ